MPASASEGFFQTPVEFQNQYDEDHVLRSILERHVPKTIMKDIEPDFRRFGAYVVSDEALDYIRDAEEHLPQIQTHNHWGQRVDILRTAEGWRAQKPVAAREGVISMAYEGRYGEFDRFLQMAKYFIYSPSSALYTCPLAMTDGAARLIELYGDKELKENAFRKLTSRDPNTFITSGQWMTERPGGSDVGRTETEATLLDGEKNVWSISGFKWFSSATDSQMTFLLARPTDQSGVPGSKGLSLFYAELRDQQGKLNGVRLHRLKNKLGTKPVPTAELELKNMIARRVGSESRGVATIATILNITRLHSAVGSSSALTRSLAIARDYARKREVFGKPLWSQPAHIRTLSKLAALSAASTHLTFYVVRLLGQAEDASRKGLAVPDVDLLLRLLTPIAKGWCSKLAVGGIAETAEACGGQGYMEETGIARLLRDTIVNTIWEGTTNVLALDVLRVFGGGKEAMDLYVKKIESCCNVVPVGHDLVPTTEIIRRSLQKLQEYVKKLSSSLVGAEESCRELMMNMGYVLSSALLVDHSIVMNDTWHCIVAKRWTAQLETSPFNLALPTAEETMEDLALAMALTVEDAQGRLKGKWVAPSAAQITSKFDGAMITAAGEAPQCQCALPKADHWCPTIEIVLLSEKNPESTLKTPDYRKPHISFSSKSHAQLRADYDHYILQGNAAHEEQLKEKEPGACSYSLQAAIYWSMAILNYCSILASNLESLQSSQDLKDAETANQLHGEVISCHNLFSFALNAFVGQECKTVAGLIQRLYATLLYRSYVIRSKLQCKDVSITELERIEDEWTSAEEKGGAIYGHASKLGGSSLTIFTDIGKLIELIDTLVTTMAEKDGISLKVESRREMSMPNSGSGTPSVHD
ncbi:hypothetical protein SmJEL517_g03971 [Synchytrium microbalum]|uniref:Uncharacterized protein n=1 Tax=Synchytrium microbalum TaxID=1806994 RepID=A0A507C0Y2_9FUNG|nr:uncharacterized protein SmJEL517_g03971 [Synchytrium microbalum]TPX33038.1 hypothetical protein SmJEL517_g03971 [Synchytrium microbalum]